MEFAISAWNEWGSLATISMVFAWLLQATIVFAFSTFLFDALHYLLHRWRDSRFAILRTFARMHWIHHEFLNQDMQIERKRIWLNIWAHIIPEFLTGIAGTLIFLIIFDWQPVALVLAIRVIFLLLSLREEGLDANHMAMDRLNGQHGLLSVDQSYHALHHIYPSAYYSSFWNLFDLIFGTGLHLEGRTIALTGTNGAFGKALQNQLTELGATILPLKHGVDFDLNSARNARATLAKADILILAHGAKGENAMAANCDTCIRLVEEMRDLGKSRLVPPEVWGVGSEAELHGTMGDPAMVEYVDSKRRFAAFARTYYAANDMIYRHIVPSAFTSAMGKGPISAETAAAIALFFLKRGLRYVPVTTTSLALWNFFRFIRLPRQVDPELLDPKS